MRGSSGDRRMNRDFRLRPGAALIALAALLAVPAAAQEVAPPPTPNADRLAEQMRVLARDPRNIGALLSAGELSARLNDPAAAAGFFARARAIDPANPRLSAGQAMVMVRMERPGEALRLFADAERHELSMEGYASDRGLAYDLIGAQAHAQREHRVAMRDSPDDETIRRYALSLGISGHVDEATRLLDPLLRRNDRAAWRARAFILAMNGDAAGADRIAAGMLGGVGTALAPFFRRLPTLSAADKAFAVHFGELRRTPARIADAQTAPPLPRLAQESVAAAPPEAPPRAAPAPVETRREREARGRLARKAAAEAQVREARRQAELKAQQEREALAARQREAQRIAADRQAAREAEARRVAEAQDRERAATEQAAREAEARRLAAASPVEAPAAPPAEDVTATASPQQPAPAGQPVQVASGPTPGFSTPPSDADSASAAPARTAQARPPAPRIGGEDSVIARIISGITIPASELGVEPMPGRREPEPPPEGASDAVPPPPVEVARVETPAPRPASAQPAAERAKPKPESPGASGKAANAGTSASRTARTKPKPAPAEVEPARHWVQVAGGANAGDLPKTWKRLADQAPAEFKGRQAWTTSLRFTNRLLVGPFKTAGEAQAFVNALGKKGISAFAWSSEAGQKIEKLGVK